MILSVEHTEDSICLLAGGEFTVFKAGELKDALLAHLSKAQSLELDLSEVEEMDTAGFQLLLMLYKEAAASQKGFRISAHSPATMSVIKLYNMVDYLGADEGGQL